MTTTEIKTELNRTREAERAYRLARDRVNAYRQLLSGGKTIRYNSSGGTHERNGNSVEKALCDLADYEAEMDRLFDELVRARKRTEKIIARVPDSVQREVLTRRYIFGEKWEDISGNMHCSRQYITRLHGYALKKISETS